MASMEEWYNSSVDPRSPVSEYINTPPKGMTSPPQSKRVRRALLRDLNELGVQLEHPSWPPRKLELDEPCDISPQRGPHLPVTRNIFGDVVESPSRGASLDPEEEPKRLWAQAKKKKEYDQRRDAKAQSSGFPTAIWRPTRVSVEEATLAGRQARARGRQLRRRALSESELRNARDVLKGQTSLHAAAVADRFGMGGGTTVGVPTVIRGAGVATSEGHAGWASDASALVNFHHGHIRVVAKSGLTPLKEPLDQRQKKKKKQSADDIDHLELSESGLFKPKYPIDESVKTIRRLKKVVCPDVPRDEEEEKRQARIAATAAEEEYRRRQGLGLQSAFRMTFDT
uniref:Uncharacterized protein n=1 Tax=Alexandrium monilatum TaxID=311494 RepID=A0A7S4SK07_9DINO